ncbi:hypothetical protein [Cohnella thailandensis]|uniref:Family 2 glycosyl transferase n=1 Tax=Cohnella thailandensis TaxID=557557 RepID=A0A841SW45_9BACL|nr:hypothetical protein [Cohnella thailandensis]MBB6634408.1 hypothetical protein [Cohnella thailandensis]MBP1972092.1 hypothetical protein [Cohnella thailandensis]
MRRSWILLTSLFVIILAAAAVPVLAWQGKSDHVLNAAILDKTVPDTSYREHKGLMWLLNQSKYVKSDRSAYSIKNDYFGYVPKGDGSRALRDLKLEDDYDLLYIADTYGVYEDDLNETTAVRGNRSDKIYGGLEQSDIEQIKNGIYKGTTLVAEFNTFGSPTGEAEQKELGEILGVRWTGWIGRYFPDLSSGGEVPEWAETNYEAQTGRKWEFDGPGFLFVDDDDRVAVLEEGKDTGKGGNVFRLTDEGKDFVGKSAKARYNYWFDVIEAEDGGSVLADYDLDLTESGEEKLKELGIPSTFPAVVKNDTGVYTSYYFAGDFADNDEVPDFYQAQWLDKLFALLSWNSGKNQQSFYWKAYRPLLKRVLQEIEEKKKKPAVIPDNAPVVTTNGITIPSRVGEQYLQVYENNGWKDLLLKGVNMGMGKPGAFPGEAAIAKSEYLRWFEEIGEMNANVIRTYTIHPPGFYEALLEYNLRSAKPLYLLQGVWINEEELVSSQDAYTEALWKEYIEEMHRTVDIIHGNATVPANPGHASGAYRADVSKYVLGWVLGIEWDPEVVTATNEKHKGQPDYDGKYFRTEQASPFEAWLASTMDEIATYETDKYQWQRPVSFTNWPTTDLLEHPSEPLEEEDMVSVDPNVIWAKPTFQAGYFASYHVYPYYPDFMNYETKYTDYVDSRGEKNSYAGYLNDLKRHHRMPVLVAEFGVPQSRGMTHRNVQGWNQGAHNEREQGEIAAHLFEDIAEEGMAGGLVFAWQDEWFKRTWNTMDLDDPNRRPFWSNVQTSEQNFGLLAFDPGEPGEGVFVDGDASDWTQEGAVPIPMKGSAVAAAVPDAEIKQMFVSSDERSVYFRLDFGQEGGPLDWSKLGATILLDTIPNQGQHRIPGGSGLTTDAGIDFAIDLKGPGQSRIWVDSYYDSTYYQYGSMLKMVPWLEYANKKDNGIFHRMTLVLNKRMSVPNVRSRTLELPLESYETGSLRFGNGNLNSPDYDSLADVAYDEKTNVVEARIPWQLLNVKDPSTREIMGDLWQVGLEGSEKTAGIKIAAVTYRANAKTGEDAPASRDIAYAMPALSGTVLRAQDMYLYQWDKWVTPTYRERLKKSYYIMQDLYAKTVLPN